MAPQSDSLSSGDIPSVTVGVMTYNYGRFIGEAIDSVVAQTRGDWEMVISDDASTDGTAEVVRSYLADPRITYVRHDVNRGQAWNWAFLLQQGVAPCLAILHADDCWLPDALAKTLSCFEADPDVDLVYGNWFRRTDEQIDDLPLAKCEAAHVLSGIDEYQYQVQFNTCLVSAAVISRRVAALAGPPEPSLKMIVDVEYFRRLCLHARRVRALAEPLTLYRVHQQSTTSVTASNGVLHGELERVPEIYRSHFQAHPELAHCMRTIRRRTAESLFSDAMINLFRGDATGAWGLSLARGAHGSFDRSAPMLHVAPCVARR